LWSLILVWRFGLAGLLFVGAFEGLKLYGFGNLWLMESLAVYPAVYLTAVFLSGLDNNVWPKKYESIFLGFCSFLVLFNLVPLWPWLLVVWIMYLVKNRKMLLWLLTGLIVPTIILFLLVSPIDWFRETIYYNVKYAMPRLSVVNSLQDWLKIIFLPLMALATKGSYLAQVFGYLFFGLVVSFLMRKKYSFLIITYVLLVFSNLREPSLNVFYEGFHLLPLIGILLMVGLINILKIKNKLLLGVMIIWSGFLIFNKNMPYFWKTNTLEEYHINYSGFDDLNYAVKTLAQENSRLAVLSSESLIYWKTGVKPATRQVVYYSWEHDVPRLKKEYTEVFYGSDPPEFIYGSNEGELVKNKYTPLLKDQKPTELYIRNDLVTEDNLLKARKFSFVEKKDY